MPDIQTDLTPMWSRPLHRILALLQAVQNYFAAINVRMSIKTMDLGSWAAAVRANHTEDQMAFNTGELGGSAEPIEATTMFMSTSGSAGAIIYSRQRPNV